MKKNFLRLVLTGLFALSVGTIGVVTAEVVLAQSAFAFAKCPTCNGSDGCIGSTCDCIFDGGKAFHCAPPSPTE